MSRIDSDEFLNEKFEEWPFGEGKLVEKSFEKCEFKNCNLVNYAFDSCKFDECKFIGCTFSAVVFDNCRLIDTEVKESKMIGIDWTRCRELVRISFTNSVVDMSNFSLLKLAKSKFKNCSVRDCDFTECDLSGDDLSNSDFNNTRFIKSNLSGVNLTGARNYLINIFGNTVTKAKFSMPEVMDLLKSLDIIIE